MTLQRITDFVLRSRYYAMVAAFVCDAPVIWTAPIDSILYSLFVLIVSTFGIAITGLVTLRRGALEGFLVFVASTLPYIIGWIAYPDAYTQQLVIVSALLVQLSNVLTWACAVALYRTGSLSFTVEVFSGICVLGVLVVHAIFPDLQGWWGAQLQASLKSALQTMGNPMLANGADINETIAQMQTYATRMSVGFVWINTILQLLISRWWQEKVFNPGGMQNELNHIRMSQTAGALFVLGLVLAFFTTGGLFADVMVVFYLAFGFAGFSLVHDYAASLKSGGGVLLFAVYVLLPITIILIPMMGLLDVWLDFRKKFEKINSNFRKS